MGFTELSATATPSGRVALRAAEFYKSKQVRALGVPIFPADVEGVASPSTPPFGLFLARLIMVDKQWFPPSVFLKRISRSRGSHA